ncbi:GNAT family N-acetyltransferase [Streptomyces beijiangensis]|uniref:GNAT family N-acetyltransferase n=1 Tax=Streptomyces beijiangensis TaxID=163361 RepID=A0A939JL79_9ACTN|nr:GNAT family N-acetyltransferase [Streptomyces beijiangensis]MBO0516602.1 GNAT family N-acetyltransferase [Streptomyces beijiangensis]
MEPVTLTTERLLLRALDRRDIEATYVACQDPGIQRWTTVPSPYERMHAEFFIEQMVPEGWRTDSAYNFAVLPLGGGPLIGSLTVHRSLPGAWETGFWTAKEHRGRGYMTEAVSALARWAFTALGAERLEWRAEVGNGASRAVAEKSGFRVEGVMRAGLLHRDTLRDAWLGALLPGDLGLPSARPYVSATS